MAGFAGLGQGSSIPSEQRGFPTTQQAMGWSSAAMNQPAGFPLYPQAPAFGFSQMPAGTLWNQTAVAANQPFGFGIPPYATPYVPPQLVPLTTGSSAPSRVVSPFSPFGSPPASPSGSQPPTPPGPPDGKWRLRDPDHPLKEGYGYITYKRANGEYVDDWGEISRAGKDKAKWVGPGFKGTWAPGEELFGGRRRKKRSTHRNQKKRNGVSRRARRRV
jgi:hypothetical protein